MFGGLLASFGADCNFGMCLLGSCVLDSRLVRPVLFIAVELRSCSGSALVAGGLCGEPGWGCIISWVFGLVGSILVRDTGCPDNVALAYLVIGCLGCCRCCVFMGFHVAVAGASWVAYLDVFVVGRGVRLAANMLGLGAFLVFVAAPMVLYELPRCRLLCVCVFFVARSLRSYLAHIEVPLGAGVSICPSWYHRQVWQQRYILPQLRSALCFGCMRVCHVLLAFGRNGLEAHIPHSWGRCRAGRWTP